MKDILNKKIKDGDLIIVPVKRKYGSVNKLYLAVVKGKVSYSLNDNYRIPIVTGKELDELNKQDLKRRNGFNRFLIENPTHEQELFKEKVWKLIN